MAQITTYFTSSSGGGISGSGAAGEVAFFTAATVLDSGSNLAWDDTNRRLSLNGPNTVGSTLVIAGDGYTDATSAIDVRTSLTYGDVTVFKVYDNGRIDSQVLSGTGTGGQENLAIGVDAGSGITSGPYNTMIGYKSGFGVSSGNSNTLIGNNAMPTGNGNSNVAVGRYSLFSSSTGGANTAVGAGSIGTNQTGNFSVAIGFEAGYYRNPSPSTDSVNPTNSVYIGANSRSGSSSTNVSNEIVIGPGAVGAGDNTTTIGKSCDSCFISGNVVPELGMSIPDGTNITFDDGTGTKIGTNAAEKFAFWNKTPIAQPTTSIPGITANHIVGGTNIKTSDTFDNYTVGQVVAALRAVGILA